MKCRIIAALAGVAGALAFDEVSGTLGGRACHAAPTLAATINTSDPWLIANNLVSAVITVQNFTGPEHFQGMWGNTNTPWIVSCSSGAFFNVGNDVSTSGAFFNGQAQTAATVATAPNQIGAQFDTGTLSAADSLLGQIFFQQGNPIGFAQYGVGANLLPPQPVGWFSFAVNGLNGNAFPLMRLTWSRNATATFSCMVTVNTGNSSGYDIPLSITMAAPAPGCLALLTVAFSATRTTGRRRWR